MKHLYLLRFKFLKIGAASYFLMYCIFFGLQPGCIDRILVVICNGNIAFFNATQYEKKKRSCDDLLLTPLSLAYSTICYAQWRQPHCTASSVFELA